MNELYEILKEQPSKIGMFNCMFVSIFIIISVTYSLFLCACQVNYNELIQHRPNNKDKIKKSRNQSISIGTIIYTIILIITFLVNNILTSVKYEKELETYQIAISYRNEFIEKNGKVTKDNKSSFIEGWEEYKVRGKQIEELKVFNGLTNKK